MFKLYVLLAMAAYPASSLSIKITPRDTVVLGGGGTGKREFICRLDGTDNPSNIAGISSMTLYRHQTNQKVILVRGDYDYLIRDHEYTMNPDLQSRATSITNIDNNNWEVSTIGFSIPVSALRCTDAATYSCEMNVQRKVPGQDPEGVVNSTQKELKVIALPNDANMIVTPYPSAGETGTMNQPISASVDDVFNFECNSNIGSDQTTDITWQYTSELSGSFVAFPGNKTAGAVGGPSDCQYRTSSKTFYTISSIDASRRTLLAIRCTVKVSLPYAVNGSTEYEIQNPPTLYFKVGAMNGGNTGEVASAGSSDIGAIIGGVVGGLAAVVIIIVLVCLLWYRRAGGESYRTKEERGAENPNMAPEPYPTTIADQYSYPAKKRGHENPTLDEPHESRRNHHERNDRHHKDHNRNDHRYDNSPGTGHGRPNYGMDRDDEDYHSRDGSPSRNNIGHMGDDNASFGTGV